MVASVRVSPVRVVGYKGGVGAPRLAPGSHYVARLRGLGAYLGAHPRVGTLGYFMPPACAGWVARERVEHIPAQCSGLALSPLRGLY